MAVEVIARGLVLAELKHFGVCDKRGLFVKFSYVVDSSIRIRLKYLVYIVFI